MNELTKKQREVLEIIKSYQSKHKTAPSMAYIGESMGISSAAVFAKVNALQRKGFLARKDIYIIK